MSNAETKNPLGTEPIGKLIAKYSIPTALTLIVNYIYNIADQIFVGQGVGISAMAATNVAFPLTIIAMAFGLMVGDGCAAEVSLCLGRGEDDEADKTVSHALTLLIVGGLIIFLVARIFSVQIVNLFGVTPTSYDECLLYTNTITISLPFLILCTSLTAIIRADGNPKYTMKCMMVGAAINMILDPVFIFPFHMGVFGAALATVIGQTVAGILCLKYVPKLNTVHVRKKYLRLTGHTTGRIVSLGFPSLITQIMTATVQVVMNNLMKIYGATSVYGSDIALSVYGMMMKVYQLAHSMFVGVSSATHPINGFNFGAKNYKRVKQSYKYAAGIAITVSIIWFIIYQIFPGQIGSIFVSDSPLYIECSKHSFRIFMAAFFIYGLHMVTGAFFQGIGKPGKALLIPIARQAVFLIPSAIFLSSKIGLDGALMAAPIADIAVFILSIILAVTEFRGWKKQNWI